jgi:uracil-DNA glycosylase
MDDLRAGRGDPWEHDPGPPPNRRWARLFAETPNYRALSEKVMGKERFRWQFGPVFYRGRLADKEARVLIVGQDAGSDEAVGHRSFVGESGTRVQHLLAHIGIDRSYLFLNTFVYSIKGQFDDEIDNLAQDADSPVAIHRNNLFDYAAERHDLRLVIAVGGAARLSVVNWLRHRGADVRDPGSRRLHTVDASSIGRGVHMVDVMHPGAVVQGAGGAVAKSFGVAADRILGFAAGDPDWLPADPGATRAAPGTFHYQSTPVPLRDLSFGATWRLGTGGTGTVRKDQGRSIELEPRKPLPPRTGFPSEAAGQADGFSARPGEVPWEPPCRASDFDPGPPPEIARLLVGAEPGLGWPDWKAVGVAGAATYGGGPVYRGRFSGVQVLVLADQAGHDDLMWARAYTGEAGQRFQGLLAALGLTRSYLILRTLPVDTSALAAADVRKLVDRAAVRNLHQAIAGEVLGNNPLAAVVAIGTQARRLAGKLDFGATPVVPLPAWGPEARDAWAAGLEQLRGTGIVGDRKPPAGAWDAAPLQIPRADVPFGAPRWQATSGDRVQRSNPEDAGHAGADPFYKVWMPRWVDTVEVPPLV